MIYRIYVAKDTFITNVQKNRVKQTGSNFGGSETLDLFKKAGTSGAIGVAGSASLARVLMQFDFSEISSMTASGKAPATGTLYTLKLKHATTRETLPSSYDVGIVAVSTSWDEGRGLDVDDYNDLGYANWDRAKSNVFWTSIGGDFVTTSSSSFHFDTGYEDLTVGMSSLVNSWLTGGLQNNGFMIKLTGSIELDSEYNDYYIKRFYGRTSNFKDRRPYVEASWDDHVADDRGAMVWGATGSLFMYNKVGGQLADVSMGANAPIVRIADASGTLLTLTGSHVGKTGIYSASFALPTGSYSGSVFYDRWGSGSFAFMTGTFMLSVDGAVQTNSPSQYVGRVKNLRDEYDVTEQPRMNIAFRTRDYNPTVVLTASMSPPYKIVKKSYYAIENDSTRERVIPFGTGSDNVTRLSYDKNGNFFDFYMSTLHPGNVYRIIFLIDEDGQKQIVDGGFKFKVL